MHTISQLLFQLFFECGIFAVALFSGVVPNDSLSFDFAVDYIAGIDEKPHLVMGSVRTLLVEPSKFIYPHLSRMSFPI